jgi:hypothetical protein
VFLHQFASKQYKAKTPSISHESRGLILYKYVWNALQETFLCKYKSNQSKQIKVFGIFVDISFGLLLWLFWQVSR